MASSTQGTRVWANSRDSERQGSLVCCSPWGRNELDTTEQLNKNTKKQPSSTASERISNIWFSIAPERNISQPLKGRKPCDKLQYGWTVNTLCWLTLGSDIRQPQWTNTLWFHFYDVPRAAIFRGMNREYIMLADAVKWYKAATMHKYPVIAFLWCPQSSHIHRDRKQNGSGQGCGRREWDVVL